MAKDREQAKKIFFDYACNHFYMWHDGVDEEYKKFLISPAQENEWRREYTEYWASRLELDDMTPVNSLRNAHAHEALPDLIRMAGQGDGYARLWYANAIWELGHGTGVPAGLRDQAREMSLSLWQALIEQPFELSNSHRATIAPSMKDLEASTPEEYVVNYARAKLEQAQNQ